ncbi:hypothetical protein [uncultured Pedobacter sp.]|uniref:hypothetical protein n=1 Tax=uncultured Pedobacter sp. TaxID=246139 RepID=UPI00260AC100|nr:hypothetical protein [uncultured Pedobacter sp.]
MKALTQLNNLEKAALLFDLFPQEMPALVEFIDGMASATLQDPERVRRDWNNPLFNVELWLTWVAQVQQAIATYRTKLCKKRSLFVGQLFDGYLACFSNYCIEVYFTTIAQPNKRYEHAAKMLYDF